MGRPEGDRQAAADPRYHTRAIDKLDEAVSPVLLRLLARWEAPLIHELPPLPSALREIKLHVEPRSFNAGYLGVRGEVEIPPDLRRDLREQVPQALLRDLYRVVRRDEPVALGRMETHQDPGGRLAYKEAREAQHREPLPEIEPLLLVVIEAQRQRRRFLSEPWKAFLSDKENRKLTDPSTPFSW